MSDKGHVMGIVTLQGIVEYGQIRLEAGAHLPERTRVFVIAPDVQVEWGARISSPRLANPEDLADFELEVIEDPSDAGV